VRLRFVLLYRSAPLPSKWWATMTVGHPAEGATPSVA